MEPFAISTKNGIDPEEGQHEVTRRTEIGSRVLIEGRMAVKGQIEILTGLLLDDADFERLWSIVQSSMASMFMQNGIRIIEAIASVLERGTTVRVCAEIHESLTALRQRVTQAGIGGVHAAEVGQAIEDMLMDSNSCAFSWLSQLCTAYVGVCSLGLEPCAQEVIIGRLREIELLLDTERSVVAPL